MVMNVTGGVCKEAEAVNVRVLPWILSAVAEY